MERKPITVQEAGRRGGIARMKSTTPEQRAAWSADGAAKANENMAKRRVYIDSRAEQVAESKETVKAKRAEGKS